MFEFEVIQDLKPNDEILEIISSYDYTVNNGKIKYLKTTNLQFNEYDNATLTIYNELLKQNFYDNGIINCPYIENENIVDYLTLIPRIPSEIA